jgi:iron complex outermembrane recepter protein
VFRNAVVNLSEPLERVGRPKEEAARFVFNSGIEITDDSELYAFGNASRSVGVASATYRVPGARHQVMDNPIRLQSGAVWRFRDRFPAGLRPEFSGEVTDWSLAGGYRTRRDVLGGDLSADVGLRYGWDKIAYSMNKTVNPSMGPDSPTFFEASSYESDEFAVNADFVWEREVAWSSGPLVLNFGAEYRKEGFTINPGEPNSYGIGTWGVPDPFDFCTNEATVSQRTLRPTAPQNQGINCASASDPVYNVLQPGSNGITGLSPAVSGDFSSASWSAYGEASTELTDKLFVDVAARFEDYESFGSKVIAKIAGRYQLLESLGVRGSLGSGFRAPSAGQLHMTQTQINTQGGVPLNTGLYPATHPVAVFLGARPLRPEESTSYSLGLTFTPMGRLTVTIDAYRIELKDQIFATSLITVTPAIRAAMVAAGIIGADSIQQINFFQNAFDARVQGLDIVGTYRHDWDNGHSTTFSGSLNRNTYDIKKVNISTVIFNQVSVFNFENNAPRWRANLTASHDTGALTAMVRANLFGPYERQTTAAGNAKQAYDTEAQFDAELEYQVNEKLAITVGGRNIFDNYPDVNRIDQTNGRLYFDGPVDWQGGYYFVRLNYDF